MTTSLVPPDDQQPDRPRGLAAKLNLGIELRADWPGADLLKATLDWIKRHLW